jgi:prolyl-tRNA synthetase
MLLSQLFSPTLRETPAEAEIVSHQLLLRAGFIRKSSSGVYTYLPLAQRVLTKISAIIRKEMDRAGGQEILMPILQPAELWRESGRWDVYGGELMRLKDRHDRDFCLGPTHEELMADLIRGEVYSWRQLPLLLYQIQDKFRDERRPRFGLMRGREFIMKDLYSFDRDEAGLDVSYKKMYDAYTAVFTICGLDFRPVEADSGAIGGSFTHEFMVMAESGEAEILHCTQCRYAANVESARRPAPAPAAAEASAAVPAMEKTATPGWKTIGQVAEGLGVPPSRCVKTLFYTVRFVEAQKLICVLVRGDREVNEVKLQNMLGALQVDLAGAEEVAEAAGCEPGFVGPVGLRAPVEIYADHEVAALDWGLTGANAPDFHYKYVRPGRDFQAEYADLRILEAGEPCPECGAVLRGARGIEVGQVFKLGTKYSKALNATYLDERGEERPIVMGSYGIGVSRTMAASVEQNYDADGIIWPVKIAPFHCVVVPVQASGPVFEAAREIYQKLWEAGVEAVLDDRDERAGVKFKDADLIGFPMRVTVGGKYTESGQVEFRLRKDKQVELLTAEACVRRAAALVSEA